MVCLILVSFIYLCFIQFLVALIKFCQMANCLFLVVYLLVFIKKIQFFGNFYARKHNTSFKVCCTRVMPVISYYNFSEIAHVTVSYPYLCLYFLAFMLIVLQKAKTQIFCKRVKSKGGFKKKKKNLTFFNNSQMHIKEILFF